MRHMYDRDGNIVYAGKVRASRRWQASRPQRSKVRTNRTERPESKAAEVALDTLTHRERIAAILASSKYHHNFNEG